MEPLTTFRRGLLLLAAAVALSACNGGPFGARTVIGTITTISVSDHPAGICDPQPAYTDVTISFQPGGPGTARATAPVSPAEIVTREPCTTRGSYSIALGPGAYEVCIDSVTHEPDAMDTVGGGTCGIHVTPEMLQDGRFDITFDSRKVGSKEYSTYS